ncbi:hypothetical protein L3Y34_012466 [Caenorhabditis briggsae]|uniref:Uncharacterized protein n=1 Tax=Caenorhabditis briggsae TaxID=6238 RepID=A0AAE8ZUF2_CAEBR|nr:hypothetical protein L3Y34_012466 [Caenorhabditis briggsae]
MFPYYFRVYSIRCLHTFKMSGCFRSIIDSIVWLYRRIYFGPNGTYYTNEPDLAHIQEHIPCGCQAIEDEQDCYYSDVPVLVSFRAHADNF